jgi:hypothetical protein
LAKLEIAGGVETPRNAMQGETIWRAAVPTDVWRGREGDRVT